jgi:hypothetical protein
MLAQHPVLDYTRYQTLNITRRGKDGAVLNVQMRADGPMLPNGSVIKISRIVAERKL